MGQTCCGLEAATEAKEAYQDLEAMYRKIERLEVRLSSRDEKLLVANARVSELESQLALIQQGREYVTMDEFSPEEHPFGFGEEYDRDEISSQSETKEADTLHLLMAENAGRHIIVLKRITAVNELVASWKNLMQQMSTAQQELRYKEEIDRVKIINGEWKDMTSMLAMYHTHAVKATSPAVSPVASPLPPSRSPPNMYPMSPITEEAERDAASAHKATTSLEATRAALQADLNAVVLELHNAADELETQEEMMLDEIQMASRSLAVAEADSAQRFNTLLDRTASMVEANSASRRNSAISARRASESPAGTPH